VMTLTARDEANNEGQSAPHEFRLPERPFANLLARAIIEQRKRLTLAPDDRVPVAETLFRIAARPDAYDGDFVVGRNWRVPLRCKRHGHQNSENGNFPRKCFHGTRIDLEYERQTLGSGARRISKRGHCS